ncbi:MAG: radical SAM protein [Deltaproteobacteria bacterium]|nr:radical SAM protein [Deltaproteobacteria bacterium]
MITKHRIKVGTSFDPVCGERKTGSGTDAFPLWRKNYMKMANVGPAPGAIFVVTKKSLGHAERLYEAADQLGKSAGQKFGLQINPVYPQGKAAGRESLLVTPEEFGEFLVAIRATWESYGKSVNLFPIKNFEEHFNPQNRRKPPLVCAFGGNCAGTHIGIDYDLNVAGCGRRLDSRAFMGNLRENSLTTILNQSSETAKIGLRAQNLKRGECGGCRFFSVCHGGCPDDAWLATGDVLNKFYWCSGYKMLFEAMESEYRRDISEDTKGKQTTKLNKSPFTKVTLVADPIEACDIAHDSTRADIWIMPTLDGKALQFDSPLSFPPRHRNARMRIWVHNRCVKFCTMWEDLLKRREVSVVLFEEPGLVPALDILNSMHASVHLDVLSILKSEDGFQSLKKILNRFLFDPEWSSQIFPFSNMLLNALENRQVHIVNRWGLNPDSFSVNTLPSAEAVKGFGAEIVKMLHRENKPSPDVLQAKKDKCLKCALVKLCSGCLADVEGEPCDSDVTGLVSIIGEAADEIKKQLDQA